MGEDRNVYRRSETLRCFRKRASTVYGHNSGESLKWAPKVHGLRTLISQANGQSKNNMMIHSYHRYIYRCTYANDYTNLFLQPEYIYICSGFSIYLPNMREKMYKKKEVMKKC